jgi:hypothetical protein
MRVSFEHVAGHNFCCRVQDVKGQVLSFPAGRVVRAAPPLRLATEGAVARRTLHTCRTPGAGEPGEQGPPK